MALILILVEDFVGVDGSYFFTFDIWLKIDIEVYAKSWHNLGDYSAEENIVAWFDDWIQYWVEASADRQGKKCYSFMSWR